MALPASAAGGPQSATLTVYADGYVHVNQTFYASSKAVSVQVPLLSSSVSDLVATDQSGSPLSYSFSAGGNITVYTLGATSVTLQYDTGALTSKNGTVWTLGFRSLYNSTVVLPPLATLTSVSGTPYSINETGTATELFLPAGTWRISYGVPFSGLTLTGSGTSVGSPPPEGDLGLAAAGGTAVAVAAGGGGLYLWRRRSAAPRRGDLRPDDLQVLDFIREKGGRVVEPEIRTRFAIPKTSAWRQIKRLERLGYVKVEKVGSQNQIELRKDRNLE
jgi:uncharacterized membrane protein